MAQGAGYSRRVVIGAISAAAACAGLSSEGKAQSYHPQAQTKLTQAAARYQDHPHGYELCAGCPYFQAPGGCVMVEGSISPSGWCPMFTTSSPLDRGAHA